MPTDNKVWIGLVLPEESCCWSCWYICHNSLASNFSSVETKARWIRKSSLASTSDRPIQAVESLMCSTARVRPVSPCSASWRWFSSPGWNRVTGTQKSRGCIYPEVRPCMGIVAGSAPVIAHFGVSFAYSWQELGLTKQVSGVGAGVCSRTVSCDPRSGTE